MSRDWLAVYGSLLTKAKYRRLTPSAKGALLHCWALGTTQTPEASWPSENSLVELLELDGFSADDYEALLNGHWLDVDDDGRVWIHDWEDHQRKMRQQVLREAWREGKQEYREKHKGETPSPVPPTPTRQDMTRHDRSPGLVQDMSGTPTNGKAHFFEGWESFTDGTWAPFRQAWTRYGFKLPPTERQRPKLWPIVNDFPTKVAAWIDAAPKGLDAYALVNHIFKRHADVIGEVPADERDARVEDDGSSRQALVRINEQLEKVAP